MMDYEEWMRSENVGAGYFSDYLEYYRKEQDNERADLLALSNANWNINRFKSIQKRTIAGPSTGYIDGFSMYNLSRGNYKITNKQINNKLLLLL